MTAPKKGRDVSAAIAAEDEAAAARRIGGIMRDMQRQLAEMDRALKLEAEKRRRLETECEDLQRRLEGRLPEALPEGREASLLFAIDDRNEVLRDLRKRLEWAHEHIATLKRQIRQFEQAPLWRRLVMAWKGTLV